MRLPARRVEMDFGRPLGTHVDPVAILPLMDYADSIAAVNNLNLKEEARELVLSGAARNVFKLAGRLAGVGAA